MAARAFTESWNSLHKKPVSLFAKVTFATGAATVAVGRGITSITKNGTGTYDIVLADKYYSFVGADVVFKDASAVPLTCFNYFSALAPQSGTATIVFANASKSATDPADTSTLYLRMDFDDSTAK